MRNRIVKSNVVAMMTVALIFIQLISYGQTANITLASNGGSKESRIVSHRSGHTIVGTILDASLGGVPGSLIEKQMDKQARELKSGLKNAKVERLGEGIMITIDGRELFEHDSYGLHKTRHLKEIAKILRKYNHTNAFIESHTSSTGEEVYNLSLSEQRAHQVEQFLWKEGISSSRIKAKGYGETQPLTTMNSDAAEEVNLRLEIAIYADEEMKNLAMLGKVGEFTASNR